MHNLIESAGCIPDLAIVAIAVRGNGWSNAGSHHSDGCADGHVANRACSSHRAERKMLRRHPLALWVPLVPQGWIPSRMKPHAR
eukprot:4864116-Amphidinium_carterae.1